MSECYCDFSVEFYHAEMRTARKKHRCGECGTTIAPGQRYQHASGKCEGDIYDAKTCSLCLALIEWVRAHVPCLCIEHGNAIECVFNAVDEYAYQAPGLRFGALRRLHAINHEVRMVHGRAA